MGLAAGYGESINSLLSVAWALQTPPRRKRWRNLRLHRLNGSLGSQPIGWCLNYKIAQLRLFLSKY